MVQDKVALMFLTRGPMPLELVWRRFFAAAALVRHAPVLSDGPQDSRLTGVIAQQLLFTVYLHPPPNFTYTRHSIFFGREVPNRVKVQWAQWSVAEAERRLLQAALLDDAANQRFMLLSESCAPLYPPHVVWAESLVLQRSRIHACKSNTEEDEKRRNIEKWNKHMRTHTLRRGHWRKSSQWFSLTRKHAQVVASDTHVASSLSKECYTYNPHEPKFNLPEVTERAVHSEGERRHRKCVSDEHYVATVLAVNGLDAETDCLGQNTHAEWWGTKQLWSPLEYSSADVSTRLKLLRKVWFKEQQCNAQAAISSANRIFRRRAALGQTNRLFQQLKEYSVLGPDCSIMARKFLPGAVDGLLASASKCDELGFHAACMP